MLVAAESPPFGPSSTTHTGRSGSDSRSSSTRWPNATVPEPALAGSVSTVTATLGAALESALRTRTTISAVCAIDCEAGKRAPVTSSRYEPDGSSSSCRGATAAACDEHGGRKRDHGRP